MERVSLGPYKVSKIGIGLWQASSPNWATRKRPAPVREIVEAAINAGVNFFDTAEVYGWGESERLLGEALKATHGEDIVVATKVAGFRHTRHFILKAVEASARRLGRKPDLIQYHWPPPPCSTPCRVARALEEAVAKGLAGAWGVSNFDGGMLLRAAECARRIEPVSDQVQYSLAYRTAEQDVFPVAERIGARIIAWSPLAKGALAGLREARAPVQSRDPVFKAASRDERLQEALGALAKKYGATKAQIALAWIVSKGAIPIPGSRRPERIAEYASAASIRLAEEDVKRLDEASRAYLGKWGSKYRALRWLRYVPAGIQYVVVRLSGGV